MTRSAIGPRSGPTMSGRSRSGFHTAPGLSTKAAAQPARKAPCTSHTCAATMRIPAVGTPELAPRVRVGLRSWLQPLPTVRRQCLLKEIGKARVRELRFLDLRGRVRQRREPVAGRAQALKSWPHIYVRRQRADSSHDRALIFGAYTKTAPQRGDRQRRAKVLSERFVRTSDRREEG